MLVLAVDTATPAVTAGVVEVDSDGSVRQRAQRVTINPRAHVELLMPHIRDCLVEIGVRAGDLDAIVVGAGPGPFTGLRAGIATATAYGQALTIPVYGVCTLDAIALETIAVQANSSTDLLVLTDARRKEVYWARYADGERIAGPHVDRPDAIELDGVQHVAGSADHVGLFGLPTVDQPYPSPRGLVRAALPELLAKHPPDPIVPMYLRRPDAVAVSAEKRRKMLGELRIESLAAADVDRCAQLEQRLFPGDSPWSAQAFRSELQAPANSYFAARSAAGELVGYAGISALGHGESAEGEIHTIGVDPQWQRCGIGQRLLDAMLAVAERHGGPVHLEVRTDNEAAIALYRSAGFEIVGTRRNYYQPSGADAFAMTRPSRAQS